MSWGGVDPDEYNCDNCVATWLEGGVAITTDTLNEGESDDYQMRVSGIIGVDDGTAVYFDVYEKDTFGEDIMESSIMATVAGGEVIVDFSTYFNN